MILFGSSLSPFVRKTLAFISEKGLQVEIKPTGLGSTDPKFREASPFGTRSQLPLLIRPGSISYSWK